MCSVRRWLRAQAGLFSGMWGRVSHRGNSPMSSTRLTAEYSVTAPTPACVFVCHGYGCKYRDEMDLTAGDRAKLAQILAPGQASPAAERKSDGAAGAWFDRRIGPVAGTQNHIARAGAKYMYHVRAIRLHRHQPQHHEPSVGARTAQAVAPPRRGCARGTGVFYRLTISARDRRTGRKDERHKMVGRFLDGGLRSGA